MSYVTFKYNIRDSIMKRFVVCTTSLQNTMSFSNLDSTGFKEAMNQVMQGGIGNDTIENDTIVKLSKVIRCNEDTEDKVPSIMLVFEDEQGGTITDFRNFSGKTPASFAKQVQAHNWVLTTLGAITDSNGFHDELKSILESGEASTLYELYVAYYENALALSKPVGIEVDYDSTGARYRIARYVKAADIHAGNDDDFPF